MHMTRNRTKSTLIIECAHPDQSADVRRTLFKLTRGRREAAHGRLPCAVPLCAARRVSLAQNDVARPLDCVSIENARDSRATRAIVEHLKASQTVRHGVAVDVANDTAQSGPRGRLAALFEKVREFEEPAKHAPIPARDSHDEHTTCTRRETAPSRRSS
jgi:hypothetical protein